MKKFVAFMLVVCMLMSGTALATGRALPQESAAESTYKILDCFEMAGMSPEAVQAYLDENGRQLSNVRLSYTEYPVDGALVKGFNGFYGDGGGIGVYGLSVGSEFDGELSEEMIADGWELTSRQFEGGFWYNRFNNDSDAGYKLYIQTNGSKIMYMEFSIMNLKKHFDAVAAKAAESLD